MGRSKMAGIEGFRGKTAPAIRAGVNLPASSGRLVENGRIKKWGYKIIVVVMFKS